MRGHCDLLPGAEKLLETALDQLGLSARAYDKDLRVARTIAEFDSADTISEAYVAEAAR